MSSEEWKRFAGDFSRQRPTIRESPGAAVSAGSENDGSSLRIAVIVSAAVACRNGFFPDSIS